MRALFGLGALVSVLGVAGSAYADPSTSAAGAGPSTTAEPERSSLVVQRVRVDTRDGRERVIVELSGAARFRVLPRSAGPARLEIRDAELAAGLERELRREGVVRSVRVVPERGRVAIEVDTQEDATATAVRSGRRIVWLFAAPDGQLVRPQSHTVAREEDYAAEVTADTAEVAAFLSDVPLQIDGARGGRRYAGRRIDLDFKDADIHNILRLLAEVGNVNIVTGDDVSGSVTIRMRNVPWDQALDVILQAKGLGMVRRDNLIRVAPLATLEHEREAAIARRKQQEQLAPLETRLVPVSYADANSMAPRVRELLSERGTVSVDERTNVLIVRDIADQLDQVEELVRTLDTQTPQVLIESRIVEATSQYTRDVGIQWGGDVSFSSRTGNPTGIVFPSNIGVAGGNSTDRLTPFGGLNPFGNTPTQNPNFAVNLPAAVGSGQGGAVGITLGSVGGNVNLAVRLSAAEARGNVRIISSPRILTLDNHEATISQGTLIPYSQLSAQGVNTSFQEAKLELRVRPHVTSDGSVAMHVRISRDEPDFTRTGSNGQPTILKRQAETDLLIPDGNTAVIGGIYTRNTGRNVDQIPFFGDIPVLGVLFQRRRVRDDRNELLIFLTPRIVNRAEALRR
jgi:type IV pilus assembly protein PilQ